MTTKTQKKAFVDYEADSWFTRNKEFVEKYNPEEDSVLELFEKYQMQPNYILEVGCSAGYRLNALKLKYPDCNVYGVEPSLSAIRYGEEYYKDIKFINSTIDSMSELNDNTFDSIIIGFVFYVVDRECLLRAVSEVDRLLKDGGNLIIVDFFSEEPIKRDYHHISEFAAYTYKQAYERIFTSTHLYKLIDKSSYSHSGNKGTLNNFQDMYCVSFLKKSI